MRNSSTCPPGTCKPCYPCCATAVDCLPVCLQAASEIGADSIVMDCEDGVADNMKDAARQTISLMLDGERAVLLAPGFCC
jgi:hypothetical protein